jgi:Zn ribbon nucleic-acid-binding protein
MNVKFQWVNVVNQFKRNCILKDISSEKLLSSMACFCGCKTYEKNDDGFKIACVKCGHGPQNHDDEYRFAARKNESQSQKREVDFG